MGWSCAAAATCTRIRVQEGRRLGCLCTQSCPTERHSTGWPALQENYFLDDGAYGALKIVIEQVRRRLEGQGDISELLAELRWVLGGLCVHASGGRLGEIPKGWGLPVLSLPCCEGRSRAWEPPCGMANLHWAANWQPDRLEW